MRNRRGRRTPPRLSSSLPAHLFLPSPPPPSPPRLIPLLLPSAPHPFLLSSPDPSTSAHLFQKPPHSKLDNSSTPLLHSSLPFSSRFPPFKWRREVRQSVTFETCGRRLLMRRWQQFVISCRSTLTFQWYYPPHARARAPTAPHRSFLISPLEHPSGHRVPRCCGTSHRHIQVIE